jgi:hypothetical protein
MNKHLIEQSISLSNKLERAVWDAAFDGLKEKHDKIKSIYYKSLDRVQRRLDKYDCYTESTD